MQAISENWEASRKLLFELMVQHSAPYLQRCLKRSSENALVRCHQCDNYGYYLCTFCDEEVHASHPLHDREILRGGFYQHVKPTQSVDAEGCLVTISEDSNLQYFAYFHLTLLSVTFAFARLKIMKNFKCIFHDVFISYPTCTHTYKTVMAFFFCFYKNNF